jgi:tetraacyldisaccharide 4'-kinase
MRAPRFWQKGGGAVAPALLAPIAAVYAGATARRVARAGWKAPIPVICCGNVVAGGSGKTTVALDLLRRLRSRGIDAHGLLRGYGGREKGPLRVDPARHDVHAVGDEALLLAEVAPTWVAADRAAGARAALADGAAAIVMDDGLQNPTLVQDLPLLVVDGTTGFGNGRVIPAGPLREPVAAGAARAKAIVLVNEDTSGALDELPPHLPLLRARLVPGPAASAFAGRPVLAFCGIASPQKFLTTLADAGAVIVGRQIFADHYPYDATDLRDILAEARKLHATPVCTRKDQVRVPAAFREQVQAVDVVLEWQDEAALEALLEPLFPHAEATLPTPSEPAAAR